MVRSVACNLLHEMDKALNVTRSCIKMHATLNSKLHSVGAVACNSLHEINKVSCVIRSCIEMHATLNLESYAERKLFVPQNARDH